MIKKTEANKDKQAIRGGNKLVRMRIGKAVVFKADTKARNLWEYTVQIELPKTGCPSLIRIVLCRYPGTKQADYTGHDSITLYPGVHAGQTIWHTLAHSFISDPSMPVALYVSHNGKSPIVLDGRQIKANA